MEVPTEATGFLVKPPRLEDAGLEDTALSPEGIQEAFRLAAQKVRSAATGVLENLGRKEEEDDDGGCTEAPIPGYTEWEDALLGDEDRGEDKYTPKPGACTETKAGGLIEEGHDAVVDRHGNAEDKVIAGEEAGPRLGQSGCVKGDEDDTKLDQPSKPKEKNKKAKSQNEDAPGLIEAAI